MLIMLGCIIIGVIICVIERRKGNFWCSSISDMFLIMCSSLLFGLVLFLFLSGIVTYFADLEEYVYNTQELVALKDDNSTNGGWFLGSGYVDGKMEYITMVKNDNGYKMEVYDIDKVYVNEVEDNYRIEEISYGFKNDKLYLFFMPMCNNTYKVYIPKDSICNDYVIDLE